MVYFRTKFSHVSLVSITSMNKFTRVRVSFDAASLVDFDQVLHELELHYAIGFAGLCKGDQGVWLYIQRDIDTKTCMTLGKIRKICNKVAVAVEVEPFKTVEGDTIESFGEFRSRGPKRQQGSGDKKGTKEDVNTNVNTNVSTNVTEKANTV